MVVLEHYRYYGTVAPEHVCVSVLVRKSTRIPTNQQQPRLWHRHHPGSIGSGGSGRVAATEDTDQRQGGGEMIVKRGRLFPSLVPLHLQNQLLASPTHTHTYTYMQHALAHTLPPRHEERRRERERDWLPGSNTPCAVCLVQVTTWSTTGPQGGIRSPRDAGVWGAAFGAGVGHDAHLRVFRHERRHVL